MTENQILLDTILRHGKECEWIEFKLNNPDSQMIGKNISALANSACLAKKPFGYIVWGIDDKTLEKVGTDFDPNKGKVGGMELELYLNQNLDPKTSFSFLEFEMDGKNFVIVKITAGTSQPIKFINTAYIRIGSSTTELKNYPEKEREIWNMVDPELFESGIALQGLSELQILEKLDYRAYFDRNKITIRTTIEEIIKQLIEANLVIKTDTGYSITNLGGILFAVKLDDYEGLWRKAIRVIRYKGISKMETIREIEVSKGFASGFDDIIAAVNTFIPSHEVIEGVYRKTIHTYPPLAIREMIANAIIHQDYTLRGMSIMVEIYDNRIELSNPGKVLVAIDRMINTTPTTRNHQIAKLMRRMDLCEERGTGIDKIIEAIEEYKLPPIRFEDYNTSFRATIFEPKKYKDLDLSQRIQACYQHTCLNYARGVDTNNTTVRDRFGLGREFQPRISELLARCEVAKLIKKVDTGIESDKLTRYAPEWA